jgi:hypothetical protein
MFPQQRSQQYGMFLPAQYWCALTPVGKSDSGLAGWRGLRILFFVERL